MSEVAKALAAIMGELGPINKDERNKEQGFNFRSIEAITGGARGLFAKHHLAVLPHKIVSVESSEVTARSGAKGFRSVVTVQYLFVSGIDGSQLVAEMVGEAVDYGDKSSSKAVQMAYKYALTEALMVGSADDPDSHSPEVGHTEAPAKQRKTKAQPPADPPPPAQTPDEAEFIARKTNKLKADLLERIGDIEKAKGIWRSTLQGYGLGPDDLPKLEELEPIEAELRLFSADQAAS